jgi:hypothetical protein
LKGFVMSTPDSSPRKGRKPAAKAAKPKSHAKAGKANGHAAPLVPPRPPARNDPDYIERLFADALAVTFLGCGDHDVPADDTFHPFTLPGDPKSNCSAKLTIIGKTARGFVYSHREKKTVFRWRLKKGSTDQEAERKKALAELPGLIAALPKATLDHLYLKRKQIKSCEGVKLDADGKLVLPILNIRTGELQTAERINPRGGKLFDEFLPYIEGFVLCGDVARR